MDRRLLGSGLGLAWDYLVRFDIIGTRLDSLETFWIHSVRLTLFTSISPGLAWIRLKPLDPLGLTWTRLASFALIRIHLDLLGTSTWNYLDSHGFT